MLKINGVSNDAIQLRLFPFSLKHRAREWLHSLPPCSITTWEELSHAFLTQYFPPSKTAKLRNELTSFGPRDDESLYEAWERYKDLQRRFPHHGIPKWTIVQHFYNSVSPTIRNTTDASSRSDLMEKLEDEAYSALDKIAYKNYQWSYKRNDERKQPASMFELDAMSMFNAKFDALTRKMDKLSMKVDALVGGSSQLIDVGTRYVNCIGDFPSYVDFGSKQIDYVQNYNQRLVGNPFCATYDPVWRIHPNFSWGDQLTTHNKMLENQIVQQVSSFNKAQGKLPSQLENPREHCKAVILRSGKVIEEENKDEMRMEEKKVECEGKDESTSAQGEVSEELLKEILSNKRKLEDYETVTLTKEYNAQLQNNLPQKLKDPGSFSILFHIRDTSIEKALYVLGASVSLMPLSICENLKVGDLKPTTISLLLVNRSIKYLVGILENVPLRVGKFFIPVDFIIPEME
ncbi:uncharacterized protein LOC131180094 [Hevea brasiliensis]|uniref:uncharacterized protein LOC131180094 n=1 Tax=Hevea brasiliensis TaxID=3981 RepID=UPI0025E090CF|nr:uncharacterized protein LOC131180094 [Hevea brasiliensis]